MRGAFDFMLARIFHCGLIGLLLINGGCHKGSQGNVAGSPASATNSAGMIAFRIELSATNSAKVAGSFTADGTNKVTIAPTAATNISFSAREFRYAFTNAMPEGEITVRIFQDGKERAIITGQAGLVGTAKFDEYTDASWPRSLRR